MYIVDYRNVTNVNFNLAFYRGELTDLREKRYEKFENISTINQPANCSNSSVWREGTQGNGKKLDIVQGSPGWVTPI